MMRSPGKLCWLGIFLDTRCHVLRKPGTNRRHPGLPGSLHPRGPLLPGLLRRGVDRSLLRLLSLDGDQIESPSTGRGPSIALFLRPELQSTDRRMLRLSRAKLYTLTATIGVLRIDRESAETTLGSSGCSGSWSRSERVFMPRTESRDAPPSEPHPPEADRSRFRGAA